MLLLTSGTSFLRVTYFPFWAETIIVLCCSLIKIANRVGELLFSWNWTLVKPELLRFSRNHFLGFTITVGGTVLEEWSARRRDLYRQHTRFNFLGGIWTSNPSKQAAANPHLRLRDHWRGRTECYVYNSCMTPYWFCWISGRDYCFDSAFSSRFLPHMLSVVISWAVFIIHFLFLPFVVYRYALPSLYLIVIMFCCLEFLCFC
jgi:hypothetical protein